LYGESARVMISDGELATWMTGVRSFSGSSGGDFIVRPR
jgi:hypothetical protein